MQTTYEIVPNLNKAIYKDEVYVKDASLFGDFSAFGTIVMDRTYDEIMQFQMTGQFPVREKKQQEAANTTPVQNYAPQAPAMNQGYVPPAYNQTAVPQFENYVAPVNEPVQQTVTIPQFNAAAPQQPVQPTPNSWGQPTPRTAMPWDNSTQQQAGGFERPRRY